MRAMLLNLQIWVAVLLAVAGIPALLVWRLDWLSGSEVPMLLWLVLATVWWGLAGSLLEFLSKSVRERREQFTKLEKEAIAAVQVFRAEEVAADVASRLIVAKRLWPGPEPYTEEWKAHPGIDWSDSGRTVWWVNYTFRDRNGAQWTAGWSVLFEPQVFETGAHSGSAEVEKVIADARTR